MTPMTRNQTLAPWQSRLIELYRLGKIHDVQPLGGGMFLQPIRIRTDNGVFLLRGTKFRPSAEAFRFQAQAMNSLASKDVKCPRVIPAPDGQLGTIVDGAFWALFEYVHGSIYDWIRWNDLQTSTPGFTQSIARTVAELHDALRNITPAGDASLDPRLPPIQFLHLPQVIDDWSKRITDISHQTTIRAPRTRDVFLQAADLLNDHWNWLTQQSQSLAIAQLPRQVVHGDVSAVNMIFSDDNQLAAFIDWDCIHLGHRLYDALGDVNLRPPHDQPPDQPIPIQQVRTYLAAYQCAIQHLLSTDELQCVAAFCFARQLEDLRQRLDVLPRLPQNQDDQYAKLVNIRLSHLSQIRDTLAQDWYPTD